MRCKTVPKAAPIIQANPPGIFSSNVNPQGSAQTVETENIPAIPQATKAF